MRPKLGRRPYSPENDAGTRIEPPVSLPSAKSHNEAATAAADPQDEPPVTCFGARELIGWP